MPFNISLGSTVEFTVGFFSSAGVLTVPTSAQVSITYPISNTQTTTTVVPLSASNQYFTGTWGSGVAQLGIVTYSITAAGQTSPTTGSLRLIQS